MACFVFVERVLRLHPNHVSIDRTARQFMLMHLAAFVLYTYITYNINIIIIAILLIVIAPTM